MKLRPREPGDQNAMLHALVAGEIAIRSSGASLGLGRLAEMTQ